MAFQPVLNLTTGLPWAYEALVRGSDGSSAQSVLAKVNAANLYAFDQRCRVVAIERAVAAGLRDTDALLSINFLPNAVYSPQACIQLTLKTASALDFPANRLIFEFTEVEEMSDPAHVGNIVEKYKEIGFMTALDDFGSGHAGLTLLARFQPDVIKIDMELVRGIEMSVARREIVTALAGLADRLGIAVVAEGVETRAELDAIRSVGINLAQGYLIARPEFERFPSICL